MCLLRNYVECNYGKGTFFIKSHLFFAWINLIIIFSIHTKFDPEKVYRQAPWHKLCCLKCTVSVRVMCYYMMAGREWGTRKPLFPHERLGKSVFFSCNYQKQASFCFRVATLYVMFANLEYRYVTQV